MLTSTCRGEGQQRGMRGPSVYVSPYETAQSLGHQNVFGPSIILTSKQFGHIFSKVGLYAVENMFCPGRGR